MPVIFKGGTSGDKNSYLPKTSVPFDSQVPQNTAGSSSGSNVQLSQCTGNRDGNPAGGTGENSDPPVPGGGTPDDSAV